MQFGEPFRAIAGCISLEAAVHLPVFFLSALHASCKEDSMASELKDEISEAEACGEA